jgi:hypothetical protein
VNVLGGELRGGAWVVIDPTINPQKMEVSILSIISFPVLLCHVMSCHAVGPSLSDYLSLLLFIPYSMLLLKLQTLT